LARILYFISYFSFQRDENSGKPGDRLERPLSGGTRERGAGNGDGRGGKAGSSPDFDEEIAGDIKSQMGTGGQAFQ
jgi:hypothetical protein